ncbi:MAG: AMP-binding protein [Acidimicrobiia bacterium]
MLELDHLWDLVRERAATTPDRVLTIDEERRRLTFAEYRDACERVAAGLAARGVGEGSHVSWQLPSWVESLVLIGALARLGAVQNPMLPIYREREMRFITRQFAPTVFVVPSAWRGYEYASIARTLAAAQPDMKVLVCDRGTGLPEGDPTTLPPFVAPSPGTTRWVFYTSGTTADPKGARHTDASVIAAARGAIECLEMRDDDVAAVVFPITHVGGVLSLIESLATGSGTVLIEAFDPTTSIPVLAREGVSLVGAGTPFFLAYLAVQRTDPDTALFPRARLFPGGGMPKPPELFYEVKRELGGAGIVSGYGMTECPVFCMNRLHDPDDKLATTEGRPVRGATLKIAPLDGSVAAPGKEGELLVKGPMLFQGYLDAALDADAFDPDGFLHTGDLGIQDADGCIVITGRVKDIIIRKGENISAQEVENHLYTHPKVGDVAVIGLPDPASGERVCAVVVNADRSEPLTFAEMIEHLRAEGLMTQKLPEQLELVAELPRNPTGKVLKHELRVRFGGP